MVTGYIVHWCLKIVHDAQCPGNQIRFINSISHDVPGMYNASDLHGQGVKASYDLARALQVVAIAKMCIGNLCEIKNALLDFLGYLTPNN